MNREDKESIGFPTPAKQLEASISKTQRELAKAKMDWLTLGKDAETKLSEIKDNIHKLLASKKHPQDALIFFALTERLESLVSFVAKLGQQVVEAHERLANVEREIKNLKLRQ